MSREYYVYIYKNPLKNNQPFYIGKGKGNRSIKHLFETLTSTSNPHKFYTIQQIKKETGFNPPIEIYRNNLTNEEACELEKELICKYGRINSETGILTNMVEGGQGGGNKGIPMSQEQKNKISETRIKLKLGEQSKKYLKRLNGDKNPMKNPDIAKKLS